VTKYRISLFILSILCITGTIYGQEIVTAGRYLELVSEKYATIRDYEANIAIRSGNSDMAGVISFLSPSFLRIDFSRPAEQKIVFNGELLTVYLPEHRVTLNQTINRRRGGQQAATTQGLTLLRRNYTPSYVTGPEPVPLDSSNSERVIKLRLRRNSAAEGFTEIILSINPETRIIRRMEGRTIADSMVVFDFTNIKTNQGIPSQRFLYDPPATANIFNNFLFRDQN
jgi:outer membrane lipoprotein-sorting protein